MNTAENNSALDSKPDDDSSNHDSSNDDSSNDDSSNDDSSNDDSSDNDLSNNDLSNNDLSNNDLLDEQIVVDYFRDIVCINCGKKGHKYKDCHNPITSYGIICINYLDQDWKPLIEKSNSVKYSSNIRNSNYQNIIDEFNKNLKILMICRKDSIGYIELIRGNYQLQNEEYIRTLFSYMSVIETSRILEHQNNFDILWIKLWSLDNHNVDRKKIETEYPKSKKKFETLRSIYSLEKLIKESGGEWLTPEWGFPKGRRNMKENDAVCACREFEEETGFNKNDYQLLDIKPVYENFTGCNGKSYRHIYYIAQSNKTDPTISINNIHQSTEISQILWTGYTQCLNLIRDYHKEKQKSIKFLFNTLKNILIVNNI